MMWLLGITILIIATFAPGLFFWGCIVAVACMAIQKLIRGEGLRERGLPRAPVPPGFDRRRYH